MNIDNEFPKYEIGDFNPPSEKVIATFGANGFAPKIGILKGTEYIDVYFSKDTMRRTANLYEEIRSKMDIPLQSNPLPWILDKFKDEYKKKLQTLNFLHEVIFYNNRAALKQMKQATTEAYKMEIAEHIKKLVNKTGVDDDPYMNALIAIIRYEVDLYLGHDIV